MSPPISFAAVSNVSLRLPEMYTFAPLTANPSDFALNGEEIFDFEGDVLFCHICGFLFGDFNVSRMGTFQAPWNLRLFMPRALTWPARSSSEMTECGGSCRGD